MKNLENYSVNALNANEVGSIDGGYYGSGGIINMGDGMGQAEAVKDLIHGVSDFFRGLWSGLT